MKNIKVMIIIGLAFIASSLKAQVIEDFKLSKIVQGFGTKKFKDAPKKIFIAEFAVNYQLLLNMSKSVAATSTMGGGRRGKATAVLILGVPNIEAKDLQANTDRLYKEYVDRLESEGFEIVDASVAEATEYYANYTKYTGTGELSQSQNPGYLSSVPTGYSGFVRRITKKGRGKTSAFATGNKLSKELGGVTLARVSINIPVFEDGESQGSKALGKSLGGVAKVVAKPNFRLAESISFKTGSMSAYTTVPTYSKFLFVQSMKNSADLNYSIRKPVEINGVFEDKKYKAVAVSKTSSSVSAGSLTLFTDYSTIRENLQEVSCEPEKYLKGIYEVSSMYLNKSLDLFIKSSKGEKIK